MLLEKQNPEIIPQHVYRYEDNLPAYKSGEWPGKRSSFWKGSKLILQPLSSSNTNVLSRIRGQKHFPPRYSSEYIHNTGKKRVEQIVYPDTYKPSKRLIEPIYSEPKVYPRNIGTRPQDQINGTSEDAKLFEPKRHFPHMNKIGMSVDEVSIESMMTRKKRILNLSQQRNGFDVYYPGEKLYKCVENDIDFFKLEGIVVGSTHVPRHKRTQPKGEDNFYGTLDTEMKILNRDKIFKYKIKNEQLDTDKSYVLSLGNWDESHLPQQKVEDNKPKK